MARQPPCPRKGTIGCAASPRRVKFFEYILFSGGLVNIPHLYRSLALLIKEVTEESTGLLDNATPEEEVSTDPKETEIDHRDPEELKAAGELEEVDDEHEEVIEDKGVKVLIDPKAIMYLLGTEMDYKKEKFSSQFVFKNPNETERCGCGESFKI